MFNNRFLVYFAWMVIPNVAVFKPTSQDELQSAVDSCMLTGNSTTKPSQEVFDLDGITMRVFEHIPRCQLYCAY